MAKSSKKQIDEDEKKVIEQLKKDSKISIEKIAKKCNFSRQKVWRIIKKLDTDNTIWGYTAITDYEKLDLKHYTALFKRTTAPLSKDVINEVTKNYLEDRFPEGNISIENVLYLHGEYDWLISFTAPNVKMMKKFCDILMNVFSSFIERYTVLETMIPIRKQGLKNPVANKMGEFL